MASDYEEWKKKNDRKLVLSSQTTDFEENIKAVEDLAKGIEKDLNDNGEMAIDVQWGYEVDLGQQFNVLLRVSKVNFQEILFRVYLPLSGSDIYLDLYDDEPVKCANRDEMFERSYSFLERPQIQKKLKALKDLAGKSAA